MWELLLLLASVLFFFASFLMYINKNNTEYKKHNEFLRNIQEIVFEDRKQVKALAENVSGVIASTSKLIGLVEDRDGNVDKELGFLRSRTDELLLMCSSYKSRLDTVDMMASQALKNTQLKPKKHRVDMRLMNYSAKGQLKQ